MCIQIVLRICASRACAHLSLSFRPNRLGQCIQICHSRCGSKQFGCTHVSATSAARAPCRRAVGSNRLDTCAARRLSRHPDCSWSSGVDQEQPQAQAQVSRLTKPAASWPAGQLPAAGKQGGRAELHEAVRSITEWSGAARSGAERKCLERDRAEPGRAELQSCQLPARRPTKPSNRSNSNSFGFEVCRFKLV